MTFEGLHVLQRIALKVKLHLITKKVKIGDDEEEEDDYYCYY